MLLNRVLVLTDGSTDAEYRATGLLDALNLQFSLELRVIRLSIKEYKWWLSRVPFTALHLVKRLTSKFIFSDEDTLKDVQNFKDGSTLVVACGLATIPTTVELKMAFPKKVFTISLGDPHTSSDFFDLVVTAAHELKGRGSFTSNAIVTEVRI